MSANPQSVAATIRGRAALDEVRALLSQLVEVDDDMNRVDELLLVDIGEKPQTEWQVAPFISVTHEELRHLIQRRREVIVNKLQNKGIRVAPDPDNSTAPPLRSLADVAPSCD